MAAQIEESEAVFAVDYRGISVPQAAELRAQLGEAGARFRIVKNTLTMRAADQAGAESLKELLEGPTAFTFVAAETGDVALAAKALAQFRRQHDVLEFKGGVMGGEPLTVEQLTALSRLPALDVLHGQLVGVIASPITGLVRTLNALLSGVAVQLAADRGAGAAARGRRARGRVRARPGGPGGPGRRGGRPVGRGRGDGVLERGRPRRPTRTPPRRRLKNTETDTPSEGEGIETTGAHPAEPGASARQGVTDGYRN